MQEPLVAPAFAAPFMLTHSLAQPGRSPKRDACFAVNYRAIDHFGHGTHAKI